MDPGHKILEATDAARFAQSRLGFRPDTTQARLLASKANRVLLNCCRQWGKSTVTAAKAIHTAYSKPGSLTIALSPSARQSGEFLRKAKAFARKLNLKLRSDGGPDLSLLLPNTSRIVALPGNEETVRGFSAVSLLVVDEAAVSPEGPGSHDDLYRAVRPMLAVGGGALWLMSTPFGKRGFFWDEWSEGDEWEKIRVPATECLRISETFLSQERRALGDRWFRQEYLCEFVESDDAVFHDEYIDRALRSDIKPLFPGEDYWADYRKEP